VAVAHEKTVSVRIDADLVRLVRRILGADSNKQAAELAITIAIAIREPGSAEATKCMNILGSNRFKI
jgi:hypothetical protein